MPLVPNLQFGVLYNWGNELSTTRYSADYLLPLGLSTECALFGEGHGEYQNYYFHHNNGPFHHMEDLSVGGGFRKLFAGECMLVGFNGFYDGTSLEDKWRSSCGAGLEFALKTAECDALDFNFNWYGKVFDTATVGTVYKRGPANFDWEAGFSHELWEGGPDCRVKMSGYHVDAKPGVTGWRAGAELKSRNGVLSLRYDAGRDEYNGTLQSIAAFLNVGFSLDKLVKLPEPPVMARAHIQMLAQSSGDADRESEEG